MNRFDGKVAFITGAAAGIGRATGVRFASEGASVYLVDVAAEGLEETAKLCEEIQVRRSVHPYNLYIPIC